MGMSVCEQPVFIAEVAMVCHVCIWCVMVITHIALCCGMPVNAGFKLNVNAASEP